jgi:hypothetical protein
MSAKRKAEEETAAIKKTKATEDVEAEEEDLGEEEEDLGEEEEVVDEDEEDLGIQTLSSFCFDILQRRVF